MPCYHPLKAFVLGTKPNGKKDIKICSRETDFLVYINGEWQGRSGAPIKLGHNFITEYIDVPCGKCIGCRLDYSRQWADRCMLEAQACGECCFVTLTYDDVNVPINSYYDSDTGECGVSLTLNKSDIQKFIKRLRKRVQRPIRYFLCGEYGDSTYRPHYHLILFGYRPVDLSFLKSSKAGFSYYTSDFISEVWPFGFNLITDVSWETCAYVARYIMKKRKGADKEYYARKSIEPEFVLMSKKPGIGQEYFYLHKQDIIESDRLIYSTINKGITTKVPRYFDKLLERENPDIFEEIKDKRIKSATIAQATKEHVFNLTYEELLKRDEETKKNSIKSLKRVGI